MSVRLRKWTTKAGKALERWTIDVKVALPGERPRRIRYFSPVNTPRRGASDARGARVGHMGVRKRKSPRRTGGLTGAGKGI